MFQMLLFLLHTFGMYWKTQLNIHVSVGKHKTGVGVMQMDIKTKFLPPSSIEYISYMLEKSKK